MRSRLSGASPPAWSGSSGRLQEEARGEVRLLNSRSEYSRCSLPRLTIEDSYEKAVSDKDTEKEEERISKENANEREPAVVELNSNRKSSSGENRKSLKTNGHSDKSADIRNYFTKQKSDRGVT